MTKLISLGTLFSPSVRAVVVAKLLILDVSPLTSFILALRVVLVAKLIITGVLSSKFFIVALYTSFLTTLLFYLNQQEQVLIYQYLIYLLYFLNCLNY